MYEALTKDRRNAEKEISVRINFGFEEGEEGTVFLWYQTSLQGV